MNKHKGYTNIGDRARTNNMVYLGSQKYSPPFCSLYLEGRAGLLKYSISLEHTPLVPHDVTHEVDNHDVCRSFLEKWQLAECVTTGNQWHLC